MALQRPDDRDLRILELLGENARMPLTEIGRRVGLSRVAVKARMDAMEKSGVILGYRAVLGSAAAPERVRFVIDLETTPEEYSAVTGRLAGEKRITTLWRVTGECRLHAVASASGAEEMRGFVDALYRDAAGIRRISCHTVLESVKEPEDP